MPYLRFIKSFHFNSRPHGGRQCFLVLFLTHQHFNSRPHGGRLGAGMFLLALAAFQLTPSRRATFCWDCIGDLLIISTHALTEGDCAISNIFSIFFHFNSRLHGGRRNSERNCRKCKTFQLTPSRRATRQFLQRLHRFCHFNSRPHGGRLYPFVTFQPEKIISTHALTEGDCTVDPYGPPSSPFQLTPSRRATGFLQPRLIMHIFQLTPSRRATAAQSSLAQHCIFQLTPSRRATDIVIRLQTEQFDFNSRPHGGRRYFSTLAILEPTFQLTPSRRATRPDRACNTVRHISTHALTEGDNDISILSESNGNFNSRPHGGRPLEITNRSLQSYFNSRPHGGRR